MPPQLMDRRISSSPIDEPLQEVEPARAWRGTAGRIRAPAPRQAEPDLQSTRAPIEHSVAVVGAPASAVGQSTTAQCLRISWTFDPATLAAARLNEPYRSGAARRSMFLVPDRSFSHPAQRRVCGKVAVSVPLVGD